MPRISASSCALMKYGSSSNVLMFDFFIINNSFHFCCDLISEEHFNESFYHPPSFFGLKMSLCILNDMRSSKCSKRVSKKINGITAKEKHSEACLRFNIKIPPIRIPNRRDRILFSHSNKFIMHLFQLLRNRAV
jgi:hypothetical protein